MAEIIKDLPQLIKSKTAGAIAAMFGFENASWDRWRVDHCNGRQSEISGWLSNRAKKLFKEECEKVITKKFVRDMVKQAKNSIHREFKEQFLRELEYRVKELARKHAEEQSTTFMEGFKLSLESDIEAVALAAMEGRESKMQMAILETEVEESA
jgi:hypothetical protein